MILKSNTDLITSLNRRHRRPSSHNAICSRVHPDLGQEIKNRLEDNSFYLAVLSANKARLVIRDWMHTPIDSLLKYLDRYIRALRIVSPSGSSIRAFSVPAIINALRTSNPNIVRGLIRTAYSGHAVPSGCLENAVYRMRVGVRKSKKNMYPWRDGGDLHILTAVIKLALTYGTEEAKEMEELDKRSANQSYLCGRLLAALEEIQQRAARYRLNTTLVERYIGSASTSPGTTFPQLIKLAESGHLPKIRKEHMGYGKMREIMQDVCAGIDGRFSVSALYVGRENSCSDSTISAQSLHGNVNWRANVDWMGLITNLSWRFA